MALTYTPAGELGSKLPSFRLKSVEGLELSNEALVSGRQAVVVMFICNHCPYVQAIEDRLIQLAHELSPRGVSFIGICANDPTEYPEDTPAELLKRWQSKGYGFPYLVDEDQSVARAFGAVCTPDFFVYDSSAQLVYRGRLDDSWRDAGKVKRQELREVLEALLSGQAITREQNPSMGCSIKWKND